MYRTRFWVVGAVVALTVSLTAASSQQPSAPAASAPANPKLEQYKKDVALEVDGMYRTPSAGVAFGDVAMNGYMRQGERPLVSTRGHLADHIGLTVVNLDAWVSKLRGEGVKFLEQPYKLSDTRAVMIEGPSREALELVEVG